MTICILYIKIKYFQSFSKKIINQREKKRTIPLTQVGTSRQRRSHVSF